MNEVKCLPYHVAFSVPNAIESFKLQPDYWLIALCQRITKRFAGELLDAALVGMILAPFCIEKFSKQSMDI